MTTTTPHVSLATLTASPLARSRGFSNLPDDDQIPNLLRLGRLIKEVEALLGPSNIKFISAYQGPRLQAAIGALPEDGSADGRGYDFQVLNSDLLSAFDKLAASDLKFDTLSTQWKRAGLGWIHITVPEEGKEPRRITTRKEARLGRAFLA